MHWLAQVAVQQLCRTCDVPLPFLPGQRTPVDSCGSYFWNAPAADGFGQQWSGGRWLGRPRLGARESVCQQPPSPEVPISEDQRMAAIARRDNRSRISRLLRTAAPSGPLPLLLREGIITLAWCFINSSSRTRLAWTCRCCLHTDYAMLERPDTENTVRDEDDWFLNVWGLRGTPTEPWSPGLSP